MPDPTFYELVHRQFEILVRSFPTEQHLGEFLEVVPIPETVGPLLPEARAVAEMLLVAPSEMLAVEELRADEARTRIFYQFAMTQFPTLRVYAKDVPATKTGTPFYELASWILGLLDQK